MENGAGVKKIKQILLVEDRKKTELNDVEAILGFDEECIVLQTCSGTVTIEGKELKIVDLSKDTGHISIIGGVDAVIYQEEGKRKRSGLFR